MLPTQIRYHLAQIASELGNSASLGEANLLCLLQEEKVQAHVVGDYCDVTIPASYWQTIKPSEFVLFDGKDMRTRHFYVKQNIDMVIAYTREIKRMINIEEGSPAPGTPKRLIDDIVGLWNILDIDSSGERVTHAAEYDTISAMYDDKEFILERIRFYTSNFRDNIQKLPVYVSLDSWADCRRANGQDNGNKKKIGRPKNDNWDEVYFYLLQCIVHHEKRKLSDLVGVGEKEGREGVARKIHERLISSISSIDQDLPSIESIRPKLREIEQPSRSDLVRLPLVPLTASEQPVSLEKGKSK